MRKGIPKKNNERTVAAAVPTARTIHLRSRTTSSDVPNSERTTIGSDSIVIWTLIGGGWMQLIGIW